MSYTELILNFMLTVLSVALVVVVAHIVVIVVGPWVTP
jgi:hypothetical protein